MHEIYFKSILSSLLTLITDIESVKTKTSFLEIINQILQNDFFLLLLKYIDSLKSYKIQFIQF